MKKQYQLLPHFSVRYYLFFGVLFLFNNLFAQITPPGYEREMKLRAAQNEIAQMDRDSVTLIDTVAIFDPETYESSTSIIVSKYSVNDYCKIFLKMNNPDILLDGQPHTIIDPRTYEDIIIRLNSAGKIDTIPNQ